MEKNGTGTVTGDSGDGLADSEHQPFKKIHAQANKFLPGGKDDPNRVYRIVKQAAIVATMIGYGMCLEVIGPTLPDMKNRLGVTYPEIARALICRSLGILAGTLVGGYMLERFRPKTDIIMGLALVILGTTTSLFPISPSLWVAVLIFGVCGFAEGVNGTAITTIIIRLWTVNAATAIHSTSLGFTVGAAIMPQLIRPFLSPDQSGYDKFSNASQTTNGSTDQQDVKTETDTIEDMSHIEIPYLMIGIILVTFGLVFIGYYFKGQPKGLEGGIENKRKKASFRSMIDPKSCGHGSFSYGIQLLLCLFIYYLLIIAILSSCRFLFAFAIESSLQLSKLEATNLVTAYFSCALASRMLSVIFIKFIPINIFLKVNILLIALVCCLMALFGHYVREVLWVCVVLLGFLNSQLWPNGVSWANRYLDMNSIGVMFMLVGKSCGQFIFIPITSQLFEQDPRNLTYVLAACASALLVLSGLMHLALNCHMSLDDRSNLDVDSDKDDKTNDVSEVRISLQADTPNEIDK